MEKDQETPPAAEPPFWRSKTLREMSAAEWEALCDGCGLCCLILLEDSDTGAVFETDVSCRLFNGATCRCSDYQRRLKRVPGCVNLTPDNVGDLNWMPDTCAYRVLARGEDLPDWHPLVSGDPESVHALGPSVRNRTISERKVRQRDLQDRVGKRRC
ncbi:MAG: YcgN family cysteine cluster protein [Pseudomonadota bacterium]